MNTHPEANLQLLRQRGMRPAHSRTHARGFAAHGAVS